MARLHARVSEQPLAARKIILPAKAIARPVDKLSIRCRFGGRYHILTSVAAYQAFVDTLFPDASKGEVEVGVRAGAMAFPGVRTVDFVNINRVVSQMALKKAPGIDQLDPDILFPSAACHKTSAWQAVFGVPKLGLLPELLESGFGEGAFKTRKGS